MVYQPNIPQPADKLKNSQSDILGNFQALNPLIGGINNFIILPVQGSKPAVVAGQMALYTKTVSGATELFVERDDGTERNMTGAGLVATGWSLFPSGLLIKWGSGSANGQTVTTVTQGPAFNQVLSAQVTTFNVANAAFSQFARVMTFTVNNITVFGQTMSSTPVATAVNFFYLMIGF